MSATTKIPEGLEEEVLELAGELNPETSRRWTLRELAAWLLEKHRVEVSHMAVGRLLARLRRERAEALRDALRAELAGTLGPQFQRLDELTTKLAARATPDGKKGVTVKELALIVDNVRKVLIAKARIAGFADRIELDANVNVDASVTVDDARAAVAAALAKLAPGALPGAASGAAGDPAE